MKTPVYFISDVHLKLSLDKKEVDRRDKLYRLFEKILETGGTCFFQMSGSGPDGSENVKTPRRLRPISIASKLINICNKHFFLQ